MSKIYVTNNGRLDMEIEDATLKYGHWFSNWSGRTDGEFKFNSVDPATKEGYKYFTVKIPEEFINEADGTTWTVATLADLGVPVKTYRGNPEKGYDDEHTIKVKVSFKYKPPYIELDMGGDKEVYTVDEVHRLDQMMISNVDLVLGFGRANETTGKRPCYLNEFYAKAVTSRMSQKHKKRTQEDDIPFDYDDDPME